MPRIILRCGWAPDADSIWAMAKRARAKLDNGRAPKLRRGHVWFIGANRAQEGEALRPEAFPVFARCREGTLNLIDPSELGLIEGMQVWGPLPRR